jgi:hypothetical protein
VACQLVWLISEGDNEADAMVDAQPWLDEKIDNTKVCKSTVATVIDRSSGRRQFQVRRLIISTSIPWVKESRL